MKVVSIILARGGSVGVPRKNIKELAGRPLIDYAIQASRASDVHETWVSTEDAEIKSVADSCGALVIDRPAELAQDHSQSEEAILHFCEHVDFDVLVFIQPTSPLVESSDINTGIRMMENYDSVISVYREHWLGRWTTDAPIVPIGWNPENRPMRQQAGENFVENGAFYVTSRSSLLESRLRFSGDIGFVEMPFYRSFQIDTPDDFKLVECVIRGEGVW